jgi:hypothetical protein
VAFLVIAVLAMSRAQAKAADPCIVEPPSEAKIDSCAKKPGDCETIEQVLEATPRLPVAAAKAKADAAAAAASGAADVAAKQAAAAAAQKRVDDNVVLIKNTWHPLAVCKKLKLLDRMGAVAPELATAFQSALDEAARVAYNAQCATPDVLCLSTDGTRFNGQRDLTLSEGEKLTVRVLSLDPADSERFRVVLAIAHNLDSLTRTARVATALGAGDIAFTVVTSATSAATGENDVSIGFELQRRDSKEAAYAHVSSGRVKINHGNYYFEFGLGLPVVYQGTREARTATEITTSTEPRAAIAVLYFPAGRHKGQIDYHDSLWTSLGAFVATDFDFTTVQKDVHVGVAYSPIQGLGISAGLSLVPAQFLVGSSATTTNGMINTATHEVVRPFVGLFVTTDFLDTASKAKTALTSLAR